MYVVVKWDPISRDETYGGEPRAPCRRLNVWKKGQLSLIICRVHTADEACSFAVSRDETLRWQVGRTPGRIHVLFEMHG
jgi:hypothetical protein